MDEPKSSDLLQKERAMSFFTFLADNYELSKFVLPKNKPADDSLDRAEMEKLRLLMLDKDFYEINHIIRDRYTSK